MGTIVVCGDSFNCGIGCKDIENEAYGVLLAKKLDYDLVTLARGSASNFTIYLQAYYAAQMTPKPDVIVIGTTSYDRVEWVPEEKNAPAEFSARNINYHQYPPHNHKVNGKTYTLPYYFENKKEYNPILVSEQIGGIDHCLSLLKKKAPIADWYSRIQSEPVEKLEMITKYYTDVFAGEIKRNYDIGVLFRAYSYVKKQGIRCIVITTDMALRELIDPADNYNMLWYDMVKKFPDTIGSLHASEEAHAIVADELYRIIQNNG